MGGRPAVRVLCLVSLVLVAASACGSSALDRKPAAPAAAEAPPPMLRFPGGFASLADVPNENKLPSGVSLFPVRVPTFVFGPDDPAPTVQQGSRTLADLLPKNRRLHVVALPSPAHSAALDLVEDSNPRLKWGELLTPASRAVFRAFAADPTMGDWLVIVDDVKVKGGMDPIPLTAYLWPRSALTEYAECGIPSTGLDACTNAFYEKAFMVLVQVGGGTSF